MISLVRVDDRLIHGQITVGWVPYLQADRIVVSNDRLSADPVLSMIVKAGATAGIAIDVLTVKETADLFLQGRLDEGRVMILFENLQDVHRAVGEGLRFGLLNLGGLRGEGEGLRLTDAVFLTGDDRKIIRDLCHRGIGVEVRLMPNERPAAVPEEMA